MYHNDTDEKLQQLCTSNSELNNLMKQYEEDNKLLLSQITHEIRNPLTLIYSTLQLIEHKNPDITQINYWANLKEDMKDVFSLLDRLSEYNHCDASEMKPTDLNALLTELISSFQTYLPEKKATLTMSIEEQATPYITSYICDSTRMKQVFTNLLKNAMEAVDHCGTVTIESALSEDKTNLLFKITNTGSTVSEEEQDNIFLPFVTTKSTGSGLGLPTVKRILLSHNGSIAISSKENKTTFTVTLPIKEDNK